MNYIDFGYNCLGPLLLGYSKWLLYNFKKENINKVYFFSRDGLIMKQAFDLINPEISIQTHYLEVSRRSLRVPILWKNYTLENILTMVSPSKIISIKSIFDAIGLEMENYYTLIEKYNYTNNTLFNRDNILNDYNFKAMYNELGDDIKNNSLQEYQNLQLYIKQKELYGKFAIVDIGWSGGMQRFLQTTLKAMSINAEIYGYYTGVADYYTRNISTDNRLNLNGYLFDFSHNKNDVDCRSCFVGLYEILFLETKGSVKKYVKQDNGIISAERYPYEYMKDGHLLPEVQHIKETQQGALKYVSTNINIDIDFQNRFLLCKNLFDAGQKPTTEALELFSKFRFFDEGECIPLANPRNLLYYIVHLSEFKKDFFRSRWKTAFLRKLFKIRISYFKVYQLLKAFQK